MENTAQKFLVEDMINENDSNSAVFRTIGEVATEIGIPPHVLRFWESKFDTIKPHKRKGGHRYYKQADIKAIKDIKRLLYDEGFTIKGAQKFLKENHSVEELDNQANLFEMPNQKRVSAKDFMQETAIDDVDNIENSNDNYKRNDREFFKNIISQLNVIKQNLESVK